MEESSNLKAVPDGELLPRLSDLVSQSRRLDADVVAHIAEVDARRLYAREATPSMFAYCVEVLGLGESEAYLRIAAARASREHPLLLEMLRDGRLLLTAVARLASHLTPENCDRVLKRAANRSKREIEELIAELDPRPDARSAIRRLPQPRMRRDLGEGTGSGPYPIAPSSPTQLVPERVELGAIKTGLNGTLRAGAVLASTSPARPSTVELLAPSRHRVQFTASDELRGKLERLQALMRTTVPDGDLGRIIDLAVTEKLERLEAKRFGKTKVPHGGECLRRLEGERIRGGLLCVVPRHRGSELWGGELLGSSWEASPQAGGETAAAGSRRPGRSGVAGGPARPGSVSRVEPRPSSFMTQNDNSAAENDSSLAFDDSL